MKSGRRQPSGDTAFTLIEVVLAISIALGILLGALVYYSQAADLRTQLLRETERIATIRLLFERMTSELRCARVDFGKGVGLQGDAQSLSFWCAGLPSADAWQVSDVSRGSPVEADLRRITYRVTTGLEETNTVITGFTREEVPLAAPRQKEEILADMFDALLWGEEELPSEEPLTDLIHFVRLRYWDGSAWQESWDKAELPRGVEIALGSEPLPEDVTPDEYPYELFRRVIYLPGSGVQEDLSWLVLLEDILAPEEKPAGAGAPEAAP